MATVLLTHEFPTSGPRRAAVDWPQFFDGKIRRFVRGQDFSSTAKAFAARTYQQAWRRGLLVRIDRTDDAVVIQCLGRRPGLDASMPPGLPKTARGSR